MASIVDAEQVKALLELVIGKMKSLETELVAYAVFLSLRKALDGGPDMDKLLNAARKNPDFLMLVEEKYTPLLSTLKKWSQEGLLAMLKNWEYQGPKQ
jgi:hypothetical protein